jgi:hypothetical protein
MDLCDCDAIVIGSTLNIQHFTINFFEWNIDIDTDDEAPPQAFHRKR